MPRAGAPGVAPLSPETQQILQALLARTHHSAAHAAGRPGTTGIVFPLVSIAWRPATALRPHLARPSHC